VPIPSLFGFQKRVFRYFHLGDCAFVCIFVSSPVPIGMKGFFSTIRRKKTTQHVADDFDYSSLQHCPNAAFSEDGHFCGGTWKRCVEYVFVRGKIGFFWCLSLSARSVVFCPCTVSTIKCIPRVNASQLMRSYAHLRVF
jgi:hypothetical protein